MERSAMGAAHCYTRLNQNSETGKIEMSEKMIFNMPASFSMEVFVINDETGQCGRATYTLGNFECPTPERFKKALEKFEAEHLSGALEGFRLMTKRESWDMICMEKAGEVFALPGGDDWESV